MRLSDPNCAMRSDAFPPVVAPGAQPKSDTPRAAPPVARRLMRMKFLRSMNISFNDDPAWFSGVTAVAPGAARRGSDCPRGGKVMGAVREHTGIGTCPPERVDPDAE